MTEAPIPVYYEASVLGLGRRIAQGRTGIYRVIRELMVALVQSCPDIELIPFSLSPHESQDLIEELDELEIVHTFAQKAEATNSNTLEECLEVTRNRQKSRIRRSLAHRLHHAYRQFNQRRWQAKISKEIRRKSPFSVLHLNHQDAPVIRVRPGSRVYTMYDLIPLSLPQFFQDGQREIFRKYLKNISTNDWVVCISEYTRKQLIDFHPIANPDRCIVAPLAASPTLFKPISDSMNIQSVKTQINLAENESYFLSVCTLEPRKNLVSVVRAYGRYTQASKEPHPPKLVLTGSAGWGDTGLAEEIQAQGLEDLVIITGYLNDQQLAPLYSGATAFLYPSVFEGFGLPVLEAMQCGCPVITSNSTSIPEVAGEACILVDPLDVESIASSMSMVHNNPRLRAELSSKGIIQASTFSWERCARIVADVYQKAARGV